MKIRTYEELYDKLTDEIAWRKKELVDFKSLINTKDFTHSKQHALVRAGIMLLYAHWEGFVKQCGEYYLNHVAMQKLPYSELGANFIAMSAKAKFNDLEESNKMVAQLKIVDFFLNDLPKPSNVPYKNMIWTEFNLTSKVLQNILLSLGLDYTFYESKAVLLDERLLGMRNSIAHGNFMPLTNEDYLELHEMVLELMEYFRNQIDNSASTKAFKHI